MSYQDGWAAVNLQMPARIPRVEFDASVHWALVSRVTGQRVTCHSPPAAQHAASLAFIRAWNYDLIPHSLIHAPELATCRTNMGHCVYADGGGDYDPRLSEAFTDPAAALRFDPIATFGLRDRRELTPRFEQHYREVCATYPDLVNTTGTYITLLTGLIYVYGWDMLLTIAGLDPDGFGAVVDRYADWMMPYYEALAQTSAPVIVSHDDIVWTAGAIFRPAWYRRYIFPNLRRLYAPLLDAGKKILFISDGDYTEFIDDLAGCGVHGFFMEPLTDMRQVAERYGRTHFFIGNADTRILLRGDRAAIRAEVERCVAIGRDCPGYFIGVTNMIPPNTPVENALYYNECYLALSRR